MAKILVTGGAGFIGSHLVDELIRKKHRVVVVDDLSAGSRKNVNTAASFYKLGISSPRLKNIFASVRPQYIYHLAAQKSVRESVENPIRDARINIEGSLNVLENAVRYRAKKFIFISTGGAIYGDTNKVPTLESHPEHPVSPYGVSKLTVDKYLHFYKNVHGLPYVSLRLSNVYGPRQDPEGEAGVVAVFISRILSNKQPIINGKGTQTRDYIYVSDVVDACAKSMRPNVQGIYNIGTSKEVTVNTLFDQIKNTSNSGFFRKYASPLPGEQQRSCLSYALFSNKTNWKPRVTLNKGLLLTYNWFDEQYEKKVK